MEDLDIEAVLRFHEPFEEPPSCEDGERVGDWKLLAFLGRGGSSEVYRAVNEATGLIAAVKVFARSDKAANGRFRREVRLLAEIRSAAFPKFYGAGECSGRLFLAEEILEPVELPRSDAKVARFILNVASGVGELHRLGFVHRDIKPGNVMLRPSSGEFVLIDMGLAREFEDALDGGHTDTLSVVDGHVVGVGTPAYSAPEQFAGGRIGPAADIHALGMLANICFDGKPPRAWLSIIRRSTSSIPEQRYSSVAEFIRAIRRRHVLRRVVVALAVSAVFVLVCLLLCRSVHRRNGRINGSYIQEHGNAKVPVERSAGIPKGNHVNDTFRNVTGGEGAKRSVDDKPKQKNVAEMMLSATYDVFYGGETNIDKKAALELMRRGIPPSY